MRSLSVLLLLSSGSYVNAMINVPFPANKISALEDGIASVNASAAILAATISSIKEKISMMPATKASPPPPFAPCITAISCGHFCEGVYSGSNGGFSAIYHNGMEKSDIAVSTWYLQANNPWGHQTDKVSTSGGDTASGVGRSSAAGINVLVIDGSNVQSYGYNTHGTAASSNALGALIDDLPEGAIVAMAVHDSGGNEMTEATINKIKNGLGATQAQAWLMLSGTWSNKGTRDSLVTAAQGSKCADNESHQRYSYALIAKKGACTDSASCAKSAYVYKEEGACSNVGPVMATVGCSPEPVWS